MNKQSYRFCVAPLMDGTDRHCRYFHRLLTKRARLYSEMITAEAIIHGDREKLLGFDPSEHPVALQIGGSDPKRLALAAQIGADFGYDEINLNVGCPSDRVQSGAFGACLMKTPDLVAECYAAMKSVVDIPVTVKSRIGVDDQDPEESLFDFVEKIAGAGGDVFIVHARKAWLEGLSPKENREVPPLDYGLVKRLSRERPELTVVLNGGVTSIDQALELLPDFAGVMLGRAAYGEPFILSQVDERIFADAPSSVTPEGVAAEMSAYIKRMAPAGVRPHHVARHLSGLFHGRANARAWRRVLSSDGAGAGVDIVDRALAEIAAAKAVPA